MGGVGAKIGRKLTKKPKIWSFSRGFSSKNVSGHRYFLQYPPNGQQKPVCKFLPNNVLFRYPPPPQNTPFSPFYPYFTPSNPLKPPFYPFQPPKNPLFDPFQPILAPTLHRHPLFLESAFPSVKPLYEWGQWYHWVPFRARETILHGAQRYH